MANVDILAIIGQKYEYRIDIWQHGTITINVTIRFRLEQYNTELKTSGIKDDYAIDI